MRDPLLLGVALLAVVAGCIKPPDVVIVDRRTALEEQALGRHPKLERELLQVGLSPRPAAFTRQQLRRSGWRPNKEHDAIAALFADKVEDSERVDQLLVRRCIGERSDGLLVDTRRKCTGGVDTTAVARLIERANRNRRQIWRYIAHIRRVPLAKARRSWRKQHLVELVCAGHVQTGESWGVKRCDD